MPDIEYGITEQDFLVAHKVVRALFCLSGSSKRRTDVTSEALSVNTVLYAIEEELKKLRAAD